MREFDARCATSAERGPKTKDHSSRLEETDRVVGLLGNDPTEGLIERASARQVVDSEGHETDALFHLVMIARGGTAKGPAADSLDIVATLLGQLLRTLIAPGRIGIISWPFGARGGIRTHDLRITSALLYH